MKNTKKIPLIILGVLFAMSASATPKASARKLNLANKLQLVVARFRIIPVRSPLKQIPNLPKNVNWLPRKRLNKAT